MLKKLIYLIILAPLLAFSQQLTSTNSTIVIKNNCQGDNIGLWEYVDWSNGCFGHGETADIDLNQSHTYAAKTGCKYWVTAFATVFGSPYSAGIPANTSWTFTTSTQQHPDCVLQEGAH